MDIATSAKTAATFAPSQAFVESMRPRGLVELGSALAPLIESRRSAKLVEIGSSVASILEKAKAFTRGFESVAFPHASDLAAARANWFPNIERFVNPLGQLQMQLGGVSEIARKMQPLHHQLGLQNELLGRLARESIAGVVSRLDFVIGSGVAPWAKIGAAISPQTHLFDLGSALARRCSEWHHLTEGFASFSRLFPTDEEFAPLHDFLLSRSWYLSLDISISLAVELVGLLKAGNTAAIETLLAAEARANLDDIELALIAQYPPRRKVIEDAFIAHRQGLFTLSIPALLLLVDGIAHELRQAPFFCARKSNRRVRERLAELGDCAALRSWLRPLIELGSVREDTTRLPDQGAALNRHMVIHGLKADYANETDSLKFIALLEFIRSVSFVFELTADGAES